MAVSIEGVFRESSHGEKSYDLTNEDFNRKNNSHIEFIDALSSAESVFEEGEVKVRMQKQKLSAVNKTPKFRPILSGKDSLRNSICLDSF